MRGRLILTKMHPKPNPIGGFGFSVYASNQIGTKLVFGSNPQLQEADFLVSMHKFEPPIPFIPSNPDTTHATTQPESTLYRRVSCPW